MNARVAALRALTLLEKGRTGRLREALDRLPLAGREMALAHELALGSERNLRLLDHLLGALAPRGLPADPQFRCALRLGAYQLLFLDGVPPRAAVHETVALVSGHRRGFANALLRRLADMVVPRAADPALPRTELALGSARTLVLPAPGLPEIGGSPDPVALRHSLPDFLVRRWRARHGPGLAERIAAAASARPDLFLRVSMLRGDAGALVQRLEQEGVATEATSHPLLLRWIGGAMPIRTAAFMEGWFVVQDPTAVAAAEAVAAAPGMTVLDLCAAPGTKTTLLAERVRPDGVVLAWDVDAGRRQRICDNAARLGLTRWIRVLDEAPRPGETRCDAVLADVPCSNTGVLARRVEVRRRLTEETFARLSAMQRELLEHALGLVRAGGAVVYSTCSIEPEENQAVVQAVAAPRASAVQERATLPLAGSHDGGYFARLVCG